MPTITTRYRGDMSFTTDLGRHALVIDVPAGMGGKDRGPTPPGRPDHHREPAPCRLRPAAGRDPAGGRALPGARDHQHPRA